jgi:hypothetical protein
MQRHEKDLTTSLEPATFSAWRSNWHTRTS